MGDFRKTKGDDLPLTPEEQGRRFRRIAFTVLCLVSIAIGAGLVVPVERYAKATGYVTTRYYAEVHPAVTGIVSKILVSSGATVEAGQVLVEFNSAEDEALLSESRAKVSRLQTEMERRRAEMDIELERRAVVLAEEKREHADRRKVLVLEWENAQSRLKLTRELVAKGLKASSNLEDEELKVRLAEVSLQALDSKDFRIYEELLSRDRAKYAREMEALKSELAALQDGVRRVEARLELKRMRAPIAGKVVRYEFVVGELLQPSQVVYEIFGAGEQVLKLRVGERHASRLAVGQRYRAELSAFPGAIWNIYFRGEVQALRDVIQSEGRTTYRVAYCSFDAGGREIQPGTTAEARIYYGKSNFWYYLFNID